MADKCTGWAIVATMERPDGTWYDETITEMDDDTASAVDTFLTEYCEEASGESRSDKMTKAFDNLPEWQQGLIKESFEFEAAADNRSDDDDSHKQSLKDIVDAGIEEDEVPF